MLRFGLRKIRVLLLGMGALMAGCTPESVRSLPEDQRIAADTRLIGTWQASVLGNEHVAVVTAGEGGRLNVVLRTRPAAGGGDAVETRHSLSFYAIDGTRVIAENGPGLVDRRPVYRFATYDFGADGALSLRFASERAVLAWVLPLKLPGDIRSTDPMFRDVLLTASPERLLLVLRSKAPAEMFDAAFGPFTRR